MGNTDSQWSSQCGSEVAAGSFPSAECLGREGKHQLLLPHSIRHSKRVKQSCSGMFRG